MSVETHNLLSGLNDKQLSAIKHINGPALVVAGPGSGKTRVLTRRAAFLVENKHTTADKILCVTFTNKAAEEMKQRIKGLISPNQDFLWLGTFHSIAVKILKKDGREIGIPVSFAIYDNDDSKSVIKNILKDLNLDPKKMRPEAVLATISSAKNELLNSQEYEKLARGLFQKTVAKIYPIYQRILRENQALDFDDLLVETVKLFRSSKEVLEKYQDMFDFIMVDEYQDTNKAQYEISKLLSQKSKNIFVVGDMAQAIYSFRGADYRNILNFQVDFPEAKIYHLEQNYRSTQHIIEAAGSLIKNNPTHIDLKLWTENKQGEKLYLYEAENEKDEAIFVAKNILGGLNNERNFKNFAVLYRTNAQSRTIEEAMIKNNIPYRIFGGFKFYARKEVKDIISYLRVISNPKDSVSWERIINVPPKGIGDKSRLEIKKNGWKLEEIDQKTKLPFSDWTTKVESLSTTEFIDEVLDKTDYLKWLDDGSDEALYRVENIKELRSVAVEFPELTSFLENVALIESSDKPQRKNNQNTNDFVSIMTAHSAKGLEFETVFLVGMEEGLFPHAQSLSELTELEEERRLCYVAITRARTSLYFTHATLRMYFGNIQTNLPSRFLSEIPTHLMAAVKNSSSQTAMSLKHGFGGRPNFAKLKKNELDSFLDGLENDRSRFFS